MKVRVYYNLNKSVWSVQHYIPKKGWRVREHLKSLILEDVEFKISEAGRQRVIFEGRKNVHAYAIGELVERDGSGYTGNLPRASYNPYKAPHFVNTATGKRVDRTMRAVFTADRQVRIPQWEPKTA
jgi:hypothetical protein